MCLDETHGTTAHKTNLFTIIARDNCGGQGVPVAYLISEKKVSDTLIYWLLNVKNQNEG